MAARRRSLSAAVLLSSLALLGLAACGGNGGGGDQQGATAPSDTTSGEAAAAGGDGDATKGADVFASAGCGSCHTLSAAGSSGSVGPDLDALKPDFETVVAQVTDGGGGMPAFADSLSEQEIRDVAAYVVESTSG